MRKFVALNAIGLALSAVSLFAIGEARIIGKVIDTSGKPIPNATITVTATEGKTFKEVFKVAKDGTFAIFLLDGTIHYDFLVAADGFNTLRENVKLKLAPEHNEETFTLPPLAAQAAVAPTAKTADPAVIAFNEGIDLFNDGKNQEAIAKFESAVSLKPDMAPAYKALAMANTRLKDWPKVISNATKALQLGGDDADVNAVLSEAYENTGDKAKAAEFRKKAPSNPGVLFNQAARLINASKDSEAEPLLKQAIALDPKMAKAYYELGMIYARSGKNDDAKTNLNKYLELDPNGKDAATAKEMIGYLK